MEKINVESTAGVIDEMANKLRQYANNLDRYATSMRDNQDITYASEVMNEIVGLFNNLRIDLLVTRPIREFQKSEERHK